MDRAPTADFGVLGVVPRDLEVVAVYPTLSSTILPHGQEIRLFRGDDMDIAVQLQNDGDPPDPVSLEGGVLLFAAKQGTGLVPTSLSNEVILGNEASLVFKSSSKPSEIEMTLPARGRAIVHLTRDDTYTLPPVPAIWDLEAVLPRGDRMTVPERTVLFTNGSDTVLSTSPALDWTKLGLRGGDLFYAQGRTALVRKVLSSQHLQLDLSDWTSGLDSCELCRARTKTVAYGSFVVLGDVAR